MKTFFFIALLFFCALSSRSQDKPSKPGTPVYKTAIGLRFFPFGISFKSNLEHKIRSFELVGYFKDGFTASLLYYWNITLNSEKNIKLYLGGSGQAGFKNSEAGGGGVLGVGGVVGVDYKFLHLPLNISADWEPSYQFSNSNDFKGWGGIAVRFTF